MKNRLLAFCVVFALLISALLPVQMASAQDSLIEDANLEKVVRQTIGKNEGVLTKDDLLKLTSIYAFRNERITSLKGLEFAQNLNKLIVSNQSITDLQPIANLSNLTFLDISQTQVSDLTPLRNLKKLQHLGASRATIQDLSPLSGLSNLTELFVAENQIKDLSPLYNHKLVWLDAADNQIEDITLLLTMSDSLRHVYVSNNRIDDVSPLLMVKNLETAYAQGNPLDELGLGVMKYLESNGVKVKYDKTPPITVEINGNKLKMDGQEPLLIDGRTFVPMRAIFEALGAKVTWNGGERSVIGVKGATAVKLTIDSKQAWLNGRSMTLDVSPQLVNGSTLVPVRFISESLGAEVIWDDIKRVVSIQTEEKATSTAQPSTQSQGTSTSSKPSDPAWIFKAKESGLKFAHDWNASETRPLVSGSKVFYADSMYVYAVSAQDGRLLWSFPIEHYAYKIIADKDSLYFNDEKNNYRIDIETGSMKWKVPAGIVTIPVMDESVVYFRDGNHVRALDKATGNIRWTYTKENFMGYDFVTYNDMLLAATDGKIVALNRQTGTQEWEWKLDFVTDEYDLRNHRVDYFNLKGDTLYFTTLTGYVYALDLKTKSAMWRKELGGSIVSADATDKALIVSYAKKDGTNWAVSLDLSTSKELWNRQIENYVNDDFGDNMMLAGDLMVYRGTAKDTRSPLLAAYDSNTGSELWRVIGTSRLTLPSIADRVMYAVNVDAHLTKWNLDGKGTTSRSGAATPLTKLTVTKLFEAQSHMVTNKWDILTQNTANHAPVFTINGIRYSSGLGIYLHDKAYPPDIATGGTASVMINGEYARFKAKVGADESRISDTASGTITIRGDGKVLATIENIHSGQAAREIDLNVTGVKRLEINFKSDRKGLLNLILADPILEN
ncbi:PQQ-binding-like beta-propeller repeat protein [Paenibacillus qinlingensis]|nr:PQQ-binding-like beta-propeller repeat protein [Paenibacillus qinlingensis]